MGFTPAPACRRDPHRCAEQRRHLAAERAAIVEQVVVIHDRAFRRAQDAPAPQRRMEQQPAQRCHRGQVSPGIEPAGVLVQHAVHLGPALQAHARVAQAGPAVVVHDPVGSGGQGIAELGQEGRHDIQGVAYDEHSPRPRLRLQDFAEAEGLRDRLHQAAPRRRFDQPRHLRRRKQAEVLEAGGVAFVDHVAGDAGGEGVHQHVGAGPLMAEYEQRRRAKGPEAGRRAGLSRRLLNRSVLLAEAEAEEVVGLVALHQDGRAAQGGRQVEQGAFVVEQEVLVEDVVLAQQRDLPDDQPAVLRPFQERTQHGQGIAQVFEHVPQRGHRDRSGFRRGKLAVPQEAEVVRAAELPGHAFGSRQVQVEAVCRGEPACRCPRQEALADAKLHKAAVAADELAELAQRGVGKLHTPRELIGGVGPGVAVPGGRGLGGQVLLRVHHPDAAVRHDLARPAAIHRVRVLRAGEHTSEVEAVRAANGALCIIGLHQGFHDSKQIYSREPAFKSHEQLLTACARADLAAGLPPIGACG